MGIGLNINEFPDIMIFIFLCWVIFLIIKFLWDLLFWSLKVEKRQKTKFELYDNHPKDRIIPEFEFWKKNVEPLHRNDYFIPPDWGIRRKYVANLYNFKCAICRKKVLLGHTHHINPLENGGTSAISNLVYLCRSCHEDQHEHLEQRKKQRINAAKN